MPIIGLTDNAPAFPRIGELRKGGEKTDPKRPGPDLDYFRFTSKLPDVADKFTNIYGKQPQAVNVFLPYDTTDENFEAWQEAWVSGGLKHRCDGQHVTVEQRGNSYVQHSPGTVKCPGGCKQVGRLKVIIPELGRLALPSGAIVDSDTGEIVEPDIEEIEGELMPPPPQVSYEATPLPVASPARLRALHAAGSSFYGKDWNNKRPELVLSVTGKRTKSSKELTPDEAEKLIAGINKKADMEKQPTIQKPSNDLLFEEYFGNGQATGAYQE